MFKSVAFSDILKFYYRTKKFSEVLEVTHKELAKSVLRVKFEADLVLILEAKYKKKCQHI